MILFYTLVLLLLGTVAFFVKRRVAGMEKKYYRAATEADKLINQAAHRPGNACRADPYQSARRQYELGVLVQKRDRLEAKFDYWQKASKRFGNLISAVRAWKGRKLPYTLGVVDVSALLYLIDELSVGQYVSVKQLINLASSLMPQ